MGSSEKNHMAGIPLGIFSPVRIAGVLNVSPESFYKGSVATDPTSLVRVARRMVEEGADLIDVGAMSTAPYLKTRISKEEEARRLSKAVNLLRKEIPIPISVDTARALPAKAGVEAGADILNDVTGLRGDPEIRKCLKNFRGLILMAHPAGLANKKRSGSSPIDKVLELLNESVAIATSAGFPRHQITIDPGIGFFREQGMEWTEWDERVLQELGKLKRLKLPVLVGLSRKSFIGNWLGGKPSEERLMGSIGATIACVALGASIIRTHDVRQTKEAVTVAERILRRKRPLPTK